MAENGNNGEQMDVLETGHWECPLPECDSHGKCVRGQEKQAVSVHISLMHDDD
jgi:hypothetical protein